MRQGLLTSCLALLLATRAGLGQAPVPVPSPPRDVAPLAPPGVVEVPDLPALTPAPPMPVPPPIDGSVPSGFPAPAEHAGCAVCGGPTLDMTRHYWISAEFLLWWNKNGPNVPLVTAAPAGTSPGLGAATTSVLYGNDPIDYHGHPGGRFEAGAWLDVCHLWGVEGDYFFMGPRSAHFNASGTGAPGTQVLGRPIFNVATGAPDAELIAIPGFSAGGVATISSSSMQGADATLICTLVAGCDYHIDFLLGFRWMDVSEDLHVVEVTGVAPMVPVFGGTGTLAYDSFGTHNNFYAGQLGVRGEWHDGPWFYRGAVKLAIGGVDQAVDVGGGTLSTPAGGTPIAAAGGLLALAGTNLGHHTREEFAVAPELTLTVGYEITRCIRATAGYNFLYLSNVVRPAEQIDLGVNPAFAPTSLRPGGTGPLRPGFQFQGTDYWAQGLTLGLEFRF